MTDGNGRNWHSLHHHPKDWVVDLEIKKPPGIDDCERWVRAALEKLEPWFGEFRSWVREDASDVKARLCWMAHLVADFASDYWWVGTGQPKGTTYVYLYRSQPTYRQFLREIAKRFLSIRSI
jgi:hypothetical protein